MARTGPVTWGTTTTLWCGQKVSEHVVVLKRVKGRFGCGLNILFNLFHKILYFYKYVAFHLSRKFQGSMDNKHCKVIVSCSDSRRMEGMDGMDRNG